MLEDDGQASEAPSTGEEITLHYMNEVTDGKNDIPPNVGDDGRTPLHEAANKLDLESLTLLLKDSEVEVNARDKDQNTALHTALLANHGSVEETLLLEVAQLFIANGVDVSTPNSNGECALYLAARSGLPKLVKLLLSKESDATCITEEGKSVLHAACYRGCNECLGLLLKTKNMGIFITSADNFGCEPFHYAVYSGSIDCCEMLLRNGDHLTHKDKGGVTRAAFLIKYLPSAEELLKRMLDSNITISQKTRTLPKSELIFDYSVIIPKDDSEDTQSSIISDFIAGETVSLLDHPLLLSFLNQKWSSTKFFFYGNVLSFVVFLVIHTVYIDFFFHEREVNLVQNRAFRPIHMCSYLLVLFYEFLNLCARPKKFFTWWDIITITIVKSISLITAAIVVFSFLTFKNEEKFQLSDEKYSFFRDVSAISILFIWIEFMMMLGRFPALGTFILMFLSITKSLVYFTLVFSWLLIGFLLCFRVLFAKTTFFVSFVPSLARTLTMLTGEVGYGELVEDTSPPVLFYVLFALFLLLVCMLMANLLTALVIDDISKLKALGRISRLSKQVSFIITYENLCRFAIKTQLLPFGFAEQFDKLSRVNLNQNRSGGFQRKPLSSKTLDAAVFIGRASQ